MHRVFISPYQIGQLSALTEISAWVGERFFGKQPIRADSAFYAALYQSGLTHFLVDESSLEYIPQSRFIRDRIVVIKTEEHNDRRMLIHRQLEEYLPEKYYLQDDFSDIAAVVQLLDALFVALHERCGILTVPPVPEPESLSGIVPHELLIPLKSLLQGFTHESAIGPVLKHELDVTELKRLEELFTSDVFQTYASAHLQLEDQSQPVPSALESIRHSAVNLRDRYFDSVRLERLSVSLLAVVPKLIDTAFGKLPGTIAEWFSKIAQPFLEQKRRVAIYDCSQLRDQLITQMILRARRLELDEKVAKR